MDALPSDVLSQILAYLDPEDIFHILGTCHLHLVTMLRSQNVVKWLSFNEEVPFPTFIAHFTHLQILSLVCPIDAPNVADPKEVKNMYPPNLTDLTIIEVVNENGYLWLPYGLSSLTRLELVPSEASVEIPDDVLNMFFLYVHDFPRLESLSLIGDDLSEAQAARLPATLKTFRFVLLGEMKEVIEAMAALPRSLQSFWIDDSYCEDVEQDVEALLASISNLPPGLTELSASFFLNYVDEPSVLVPYVAKLPRSLTRLVNFENDEGFLPVLPPALTSLDLAYRSVGFDGDVSLPASLTELSCACVTGDELVQCLAKSRLPVLTHLKLSDVGIIPPGTLPVNLISLDFDGELLEVEDEPWNNRPLGRLQRLRQLDVSAATSITRQFLSDIPASLTSLRLDQDYLHVDLLLYLSHTRALTRLYAKFLQGLLKDNHIGSLPRSLIELELFHASDDDNGRSPVFLSSNGWLKFPPKLTRLSLSLPGNCTWTPPPNLSSLVYFNAN